MVKYLIGNVKGEDGISPSAKVEQKGNAATITITDASGTTTATIVGGGSGGSYVAGEGIDITNNTISVDNTIATKDEIPTELSELTNDVGFITEETEPEFNASAAATITAEDIQDWDSKSDFSGSYNDLTNKPDLSQYATTQQLAGKQDTLTAGANITIENNVISATGGGGGTTYTAGEGINISGTEISIDEQVVALKSELFSGDYDDLSNKPTIPTVPTNVSAFTNDAGYITSYTETDPVFTASPAHGITASDISSWNNKQDALTAGNNIQINNGTISATDTTYTAGTGISIQNNVISATGGGGTTYTAGNGIDISNDEISIDETVVALKSDIPADELPSISSGDAGKVLKVNSTEDGVEWGTAGGSDTTRVIKVDTWDSSLDILTLPNAEDRNWLLALCNGNKDKSNCVLAIGTAEIEYFIPTKWYTFYGSETTPHTHKRVVFSSMRKDERKECYVEADEEPVGQITVTTYIIGEITSTKEPRIITYQSNISDYSADDKEYIENCFANGIENYPFVLIYTSGNNTYRFEPQGIQPFTNALVCFSWGNATGSGLNYSFQSQTFTFTFNNGTLNNQFLSGYGVSASGVVSREATDNPSGQSNTTVNEELKYIKNNYATKLGWNIPKYEITSWTYSNWSTTVVNWLKAIRDEGYEKHPGILWYTGLNNTDNDYWLFSGNGTSINYAEGGTPCPQLIFTRYTNFDVYSANNYAYDTDFYGPHIRSITMYPDKARGIIAVENKVFPPIPDRTVITNKLKSPSGLAQSLDLELEYIKDNYSYPTIASGDAGKVLAVNSGETGVEWTTPSGGGTTYTAGNGISIDANNVISKDVAPTPLFVLLSFILTGTETGQYSQGNSILTMANSTASLQKINVATHIANLKNYGMTITQNGTDTTLIPAIVEAMGDDKTAMMYYVSMANMPSQYTYQAGSTQAMPNDYMTWGLNNDPTLIIFNKNIPYSSSGYGRWIVVKQPWKFFQNHYFNSQQGLTSHSIAAAIDELASGKQNTLTAGTGITISNNVISASGGGSSYTAGNGIVISNNEISVDNQLDFTDNDGVSDFYNTVNGVQVYLTKETNGDLQYSTTINPNQIIVDDNYGDDITIKPDGVYVNGSSTVNFGDDGGGNPAFYLGWDDNEGRLGDINNGTYLATTADIPTNQDAPASALYLFDATTGEPYELKIDNGQIVLTNMSL